MTHSLNDHQNKSHLTWAWPAALILIVQAALYVWMAPRGFEFTDESYYFNNYLHWREFTGTVTFFGAFFEWPFRLLHVGGIRILSLVLLLVSSWILTRELLIFWSSAASGRREAANWAYYPGPMAASMLYFGYLSTLRAPSYNLLCLCSAALATACLLRSIPAMRSEHPPRATAFCYGVAIAVCALSKATTAVLLVVLHLFFFVTVSRPWRQRQLLRITLCATAGVAASFALLTVQFPHWINSLQEGIALMRVRGGYGMIDSLRELSWDIQRQLVHTGPYIVAGYLLLELICRSKRAPSRFTISLLSLVLISAGVAVISANQQSQKWLFVMAGVALGLHRLVAFARLKLPNADTRRRWALLLLLFCLPAAISFGTNMPILGHSAIAAIFVYSAVFLILYRIYELGLLTKWAMALNVALLCIPALMSQVQALIDVKHTYRQVNAMAEQRIPVRLGSPEVGVMVGAHTEKVLRDFVAMSTQAGMRPGQDLLDFSGDGPGLIYAVGANPLGTPWMIGGYPGSAAMAERVIEKTPELRLRQAWLLTSSNNPRRINDWEGIMARRLGPGTHKLVATMNMISMYSFDPDKAATLNLQLWEPVANKAP